jgi:hypothetical protein
LSVRAFGISLYILTLSYSGIRASDATIAVRGWQNFCLRNGCNGTRGHEEINKMKTAKAAYPSAENRRITCLSVAVCCEEGAIHPRLSTPLLGRVVCCERDAVLDKETKKAKKVCPPVLIAAPSRRTTFHLGDSCGNC